jgi:hypothetical protein
MVYDKKPNHGDKLYICISNQLCIHVKEKLKNKTFRQDNVK